MVFKVAYIGFLSEIKGLKQLYSAMKELKDDAVEFYLFGDIERNKFTIKHQMSFKLQKSYYGIDDLKSLIDEYKIDCAILPSICNETYSYVLSECWQCGLPVIGSKFGAIGQRIILHDGGWVIDPYNVDEIVLLIKMLIQNPDLILIYKENVINIRLKSLNTMIDEYHAIYEELV